MPPTATAIVTETKQSIKVEEDKPKDDYFEDVHSLGDRDGKVIIRSPPKFDNILDDRKYQMQHLAAAFRAFARQGFDEGVAGHISLRDPVNPGKLLIYDRIEIYTGRRNRRWNIIAC
jgi:hypothetical protein